MDLVNDFEKVKRERREMLGPEQSMGQGGRTAIRVREVFQPHGKCVHPSRSPRKEIDRREQSITYHRYLSGETPKTRIPAGLEQEVESVH